MKHKQPKTERGAARPSTVDKDGEYRYIFTTCGNWWYSIDPNPMRRDGCICPKCGKIVKVFMPLKESEE